ncbi:MAG: hypothetical protein K2L02_04245 [Clostridia bacterium]|nr:hypothetical protein [Clostridia bacterium]
MIKFFQRHAVYEYIKSFYETLHTTVQKIL